MKNSIADGQLYDTEMYKEFVITLKKRNLLSAKYTDKNKPSKQFSDNHINIEAGIEIENSTPTQEEINTLRSMVLNEVLNEYSE